MTYEFEVGQVARDIVLRENALFETGNSFSSEQKEDQKKLTGARNKIDDC